MVFLLCIKVYIPTSICYDNYLIKVHIYLFKLVTNQLEGFVNGISMSSDCDDTFRARSVANINFGTTLKEEIIYHFHIFVAKFAETRKEKNPIKFIQELSNARSFTFCTKVIT